MPRRGFRAARGTRSSPGGVCGGGASKLLSIDRRCRGLGGGAHVTPTLALNFGTTPTAAVSSDLVAAMIMKPVGSSVHMRRGTVKWELVRCLCLGSVPAAASGVFILRALGNSDQIENTI